MSEETDIYQKLIDGSQHTKEIEVDTEHGVMHFTMRPLTRDQRFNFISKMPEGFFKETEGKDVMDDSISSEDVPSGEAIKAMEKVIITSLKHVDLAPREIARLVKNSFEDEAVFELSSEIIEYSTDISGITGFRKAQ